MERTEQYNPEDLEHLMLERSFDELLEEERAYALRHIEGRAEYERMRALLHHVREDRRDDTPMDADPAVREHVLAAFREQRQPQWRIWLNSVGAFLLPARPTLYWRPVLALGTIAVLIFASLMTWQTMQPKENKVLAEVKETPPPAAPAKPAMPAVQADTATPQEEQELAPASGAVASTPSLDKQAEDADVQEDFSTENTKAKQARVASPAPPPVADAPAAKADELAATGYAERVENERDVAANADSPHAPKAASTRLASPPATAEDAGAAGTYATLNDGKKKNKAGPAYSEDDLLGLLRAAW